jgi:2-methylisocitrate lyase-like PEP mutase family enzyme
MSSLAELASLGVARVSFGPRLQRSAYEGFATQLSALSSHALSGSLR